MRPADVAYPDVPDAVVALLPHGATAPHAPLVALAMDEAYCRSPAEATAAERAKTYGTLTEMPVESIREAGRS